MRSEAGKCGFLARRNHFEPVVVALEGLFFAVLCLILTNFNLRLVVVASPALEGLFFAVRA